MGLFSRKPSKEEKIEELADDLYKGRRKQLR